MHAVKVYMHAYCVYHIHTWETQNKTHAQEDIDGVTFNIWNKTHVIQRKVCPVAMGGKEQISYLLGFKIQLLT